MKPTWVLPDGERKKRFGKCQKQSESSHSQRIDRGILSVELTMDDRCNLQQLVNNVLLYCVEKIQVYEHLYCQVAITSFQGMHAYLIEFFLYVI